MIYGIFEKNFRFFFFQKGCESKRTFAVIAAFFGASGALATSGHVVPGAVAFAEVLWRFDLHGVGQALSEGLDERRDVRPRGRLGKRGRVDGHIGARDVVDFDGQDGDAGALVLEGKVHSPGALRQGNVAHFRVDDHVVVGRETALVRSDPVNQRVRVGVLWGPGPSGAVCVRDFMRK